MPTTLCRFVALLAACSILMAVPRHASAQTQSISLNLPLDDLVNLDEERARLIKEVGKIEDELARVQRKLTNTDFLAKAKNEVVHKEREKATQFEEKIGYQITLCPSRWLQT